MTNVAPAPIFQSFFSVFPRVSVKPRHLGDDHQTRERRSVGHRPSFLPVSGSVCKCQQSISLPIPQAKGEGTEQSSPPRRGQERGV